MTRRAKAELPAQAGDDFAMGDAGLGRLDHALENVAFVALARRVPSAASASVDMRLRLRFPCTP